MNSDESMAKSVPWVTILTPVRNGVEFLEAAAMSVFQQTADGWVWIIGVNGHGGAAYAEAMRLKGVAERVVPGGTVIVRNLPTARSKVEALNEMAAEATTPWVALLDCDDTWDPSKLAQQRVATETYAAGADVIGTFCYYFGDMVSLGAALPYGWIDRDQTMKGNPIINSSALFRRRWASWNDVFGLEDYDLWIRVAKGGGMLYNIPQWLVHHRIHAASAFNGKGRQDLAGLLEYHK